MRVWFGAALCAAAAGPALAQGLPATTDRVAVVIGNADYARIVDLPNAVNDADAMAAMLRDFGYRVFAATDLDRRGFEELLREAMLNAPEGADIVFFYAGHGIQIGARNYLLPVDVDFTDVHDLPQYSITLDRVIDALSTRGAVHVAFIDACRENPFPDLRIAADIDATLYETRSGFEPFRTPLNSLVAFSTAPGEVAVDGGDGDNSPYTAAIVAAAQAAPTENVVTLLGSVREAVYNATGGAQVPWESSTLVAPFSFVEAEATLADATTTPEAAADLGPERSAATLPPVTVAAEMMLDRFVRLDTTLRAAMDGSFEAPEVVTAPRFGEVAIDPATGGVYLRPRLQEIRAAESPDYRLTDRVGIEVGPADARRVVTLDLTLVPDACDVQAGDALDLGGVGLYRFPNEIDVAAALAACRAAVAAHSDIARFHYQLGRAERAATDFEGALASFETAVALGHLRANNALAALLTTQRIDREVFAVPFDPDRAVTLLQAAIDGGDPYAMQQRGITLTRNATSEEERRAGYELIDRAAEIGHTYAMNWLGYYHFESETPHFAPERGIAYLEASAAREDIYGYAGLAQAALRGLDGGEPDFARAFANFEHAALGGHPTAPASLGRMILRGEAGAVDPAAALAWFDMGVARGDGRAAVSAANLLLRENADRWAPAYAALRAAKGALLEPSESATEARAILDGIDARDLGYALQKMLVELGEDVVIDGQIGQATLGTLARLMEETGLDPATLPEDPAERVIMAARIGFARNPVRPDVF